MKFVSNRDLVVRSLTGHSIKFVKGVPTKVPSVMHAEVMEKGILPVNEDGSAVEPGQKEVVAEKPKIVLPPDDQEEREAAIEAAIEAIVKRNNPTDFTGGGEPSASSVTAAIGWKADRKDVRKVWLKHRAKLKGNGSE